ncbi:hypothetical protein GTQ40_09400 [Flavobacteriaceae bacterium R38]|nr:hypothetical protein [Flavobacteriaceae bacterium R38]
MNYYIIALALYSVVFIVSTYYTNAKFRRLIKNVITVISNKFTLAKNTLIGSKGLTVQQINE